MFRALLCPSSGAHDYNADYHIGHFFVVVVVVVVFLFFSMHVVKSLNYFTNHCTYIKFIKLSH